MPVRRAPALAVILLLAGCSLTAPGASEEAPAPAPASPAAPTSADETPEEPSPPTPSATSAAEPSSPSPPSAGRASPRLDSWVVGERPLPLRPDGFGVVEATPAELRVRRLATPDLLPPPPDSRWHATIGPVTRRVRARMGEAWSPGCPVPLADLRYLRMSFWGFDGLPHRGDMVVHTDVAEDVVSVFRALHRARFPLEEMRLVTTADLEAPPTGDGNVTAAFVCRATRGATTWSAHAYGLAIDVNPFLNPYTRDDLVLPELASAYLDQSWRRPGMVLAGGVVERAFADIGWTWGGTFRSLKDYQHFSATGR